MKRSLLLLLVLVGLAVAGIVAATGMTAAPEAGKPLITVLYPKEETDGLLWPNDYTCIFSVDHLDTSIKSNSLSLAVRAIHQEIEQGTTPTIGSRTISKAESRSTIRLGKSLGVKPTAPTIVSVQLIDLNAARIPPGPDKRPLRLLLKLKHRAGTTSKTEVIEGDSLAGSCSPENQKWKDGELHLWNFFVVSGDKLTTYDVVLLRPKDE
jgi:hypothetical protein